MAATTMATINAAGSLKSPTPWEAAKVMPARRSVSVRAMAV
jgi:hypothetical protein